MWMHCVMEFFSCDDFLYVFVQNVVTNVYGTKDLDVDKTDVDLCISCASSILDSPISCGFRAKFAYSNVQP